MTNKFLTWNLAPTLIHGGERFMNVRFKRNVFAGLFVAPAAISAYMLLAPVAFTEADIISLAI